MSRAILVLLVLLVVPRLITEGKGDNLEECMHQVCSSHHMLCPVPVSLSSNKKLSLPLPTFLALEIYSRNWWTELLFHNTTGGGCGLVQLLTFADKRYLRARVCGSEIFFNTFDHSSCGDGGAGWWLVEVATVETQLRLSLLKANTAKETVITLHYEDVPSAVTVWSSKPVYIFGPNTSTTSSTKLYTTTNTAYVTTLTTTTTTTSIKTAETTTSTTSPPSPPQVATMSLLHLQEIIAILVYICVVLSVAILVLCSEVVGCGTPRLIRG